MASSNLKIMKSYKDHIINISFQIIQDSNHILIIFNLNKYAQLMSKFNIKLCLSSQNIMHLISSRIANKLHSNTTNLESSYISQAKECKRTINTAFMPSVPNQDLTSINMEVRSWPNAAVTKHHALESGNFGLTIKSNTSFTLP